MIRWRQLEFSYADYQVNSCESRIQNSNTNTPTKISIFGYPYQNKGTYMTELIGKYQAKLYDKIRLNSLGVYHGDKQRSRIYLGLNYYKNYSFYILFQSNS